MGFLWPKGDTMKNTAPPRAFRGRGLYGGSAPDRGVSNIEGGAGGMSPRKMSRSVGHSGSGPRWQTSRGCERGETPGDTTRKHHAPADKKGGRSPLPLSPDRREGGEWRAWQHTRPRSPKRATRAQRANGRIGQANTNEAKRTITARPTPPTRI